MWLVLVTYTSYVDLGSVRNHFVWCRAPSRFADIRHYLNLLDACGTWDRPCCAYGVLIWCTSGTQFPELKSLRSSAVPNATHLKSVLWGVRGGGDMGRPESCTCYSRTLVTLMRSALMTGALRMGNDICHRTGFAPQSIYGRYRYFVSKPITQWEFIFPACFVKYLLCIESFRRLEIYFIRSRLWISLF
jgi:hypothetical protein